MIVCGSWQSLCVSVLSLFWIGLGSIFGANTSLYFISSVYFSIIFLLLMPGDMDDTKETKARQALHDLGLRIADKWASGFQDKPTQQLILQKIIDPAVKHILNSISPWIVGMGVLFLVLLTCTVVTCIIVLRGSPQAYHNPLDGIARLVSASVQSS